MKAFLLRYRCYELLYINGRTQFWRFKKLICLRFKTSVFSDGDVINSDLDILISTDILNISDLDALSFFKEWAYSISVKSSMAIKVPCHIVMNGRPWYWQHLQMVIQAPYHIVMNRRPWYWWHPQMAIKAPYHIVMNGRPWYWRHPFLTTTYFMMRNSREI